MVGYRTFYFSLIISFIIHGVLIIVIPRIRQIKLKDDLIGRYTKVQLISIPSSVAKKRSPEHEVKGKIPVPEMNPIVKNRLSRFSDSVVPSFDLSLPQKKETAPLSYQDLICKEDILEETMPEPTTFLPTAQLMEIAGKREEDFPKPSLEEHNFDTELLMDEVIEDIPSDSMDIEWLSGKPRQIVTKPAYPPTYPPGYERHQEGRIRLQFWVDADGFVIRVRPRQKLDPRLDAVATEYLRQYRFEPLRKNQENQSQQGIIPFSFRLK